MARMPQPIHTGSYIRDIPDYPAMHSEEMSQEAEAEGWEEFEKEDEKSDTVKQRHIEHVQEELTLTKTGRPDRRYLGARHLPPEAPENPDYRKARTGGMVGGIHVTLTGKPDRRFKENRDLSEDEVNNQWVEVLDRRYRKH